MKIAQLTAGTGSFYCGNCIRDSTLVRALRTRGHDAHLVPLYLPVVSEIDAATITAKPASGKPLFYGGVNVYLQQKLKAFRWTPRWIDRFFDSDWVIGQASARTHMTRAKDLGELTVSMLRGEAGHQAKELDRLLTWLELEERPDLINLSNILLVGLAPALKERLNIPITCTLHGEDAYLDSLPEPYRNEAWQLIQKHAITLDGILAVSDYFRGVMGPRVGLPERAIDVVHNGISLEGYHAHSKKHGAASLIWGYLARMCHDKGLTTLVDSFILLKKTERFPQLRLHIGGVATKSDDEYISKLKGKLEQAGLSGEVTWFPNLTPEAKRTFLAELSLFSVPATYGEAFGLYVIEAAACGIPVLQPDHGAFPELAALIGLEPLCKPDDPADLARAAEAILIDHEAALTRAERCREIVHEKYSDSAMAERVESVYLRVVNEYKNGV